VRNRKGAFLFGLSGKGRLAGIACGEPTVTAPIRARPIEPASQGRRLNGDARMAALAPVVLVESPGHILSISNTGSITPDSLATPWSSKLWSSRHFCQQ
jgi:hypothetical protein